MPCVAESVTTTFCPVSDLSFGTCDITYDHRSHQEQDPETQREMDELPNCRSSMASMVILVERAKEERVQEE
jgi:hypothetical protein